LIPFGNISCRKTLRLVAKCNTFRRFAGVFEALKAFHEAVKKSQTHQKSCRMTLKFASKELSTQKISAFSVTLRKKFFNFLYTRIHIEDE